MAKYFHLTIAHVADNLFSGDVVSVSLPGSEGMFEVLGGHAAFVSELRAGEARVTSPDGAVHRFPIAEGGIAEVSGNQATILL